MGWKKGFLSVLKGLAKAISLGLIGRGRKTQQAGEIAGDILDNLNKEKDDGISK